MGNKSGAGSVAFLLSQVGARSAQEFARLLAPLNLTPPDAGILRLLRQSPGISQQQLAQTLGMHASRLVAVIDALEKRGVVVREANANDRRLYSLRLTEAGDEMLREIGQVARAHNELMCSGLRAGLRIEVRAGVMAGASLEAGAVAFVSALDSSIRHVFQAAYSSKRRVAAP
jgi:DNA-binding MarR family transcriptional regulator